MTVGAELLRTSTALLAAYRRCGTLQAALHELRVARWYPAALLDALETVPERALEGAAVAIQVDALACGMHLEADLRTRAGAVLARRGVRVTAALVRHVQNQARLGGIEGPLHVRFIGARTETLPDAPEDPS